MGDVAVAGVHGATVGLVAGHCARAAASSLRRAASSSRVCALAYAWASDRARSAPRVSGEDPERFSVAAT